MISRSCLLSSSFSRRACIGASNELCTQSIPSLVEKWEKIRDEEPLLMIPGPVEASPEVKKLLGMPPLNHVGTACIKSFSSSLKKMHQVWQADETTQPYILPGSGTLGMEVAIYNLLAPNDRALVLPVGYFGQRFHDMLERSGRDFVSYTCPRGEAPTEQKIRSLLEEAKQAGKPFKAVFATHVDTSVGVRTDPEMVSRLAKEYGALSIFDGVCATVCEKFYQSKWGADMYFTGSQKVLSLPGGLSLFVVSQKALEARQNLANSAQPPMYMDLLRWQPIMQAYHDEKPSYFATPCTSMIPALDVALSEFLPMDASYALHQKTADGFRAGVFAMGLSTVANADVRGNTLTASYLPKGVPAPDFVGKVKAKGVQVAGPLLPDLAPYFRTGHMGYTTRRPDFIYKTLTALEDTLLEMTTSENRGPIQKGAAVAAAREILEN